VTVTSLAHTAVRVGDLDAAVAWYHDILGLEVLSPPYRMEGDEIARDMGELVPAPVVVNAAIVGFGSDGDHVLEVIEYPAAEPPGPARAPSVLHLGFTHVGLVCDDIAATRATLEAAGVRFLVSGIADVAGLRTTWFTDPWDNVFILVEKVRRADAPYFRQYR
jgi:catechol 2,3-dioxygenase-like lactoylglutathione lyase family enzyme